MLEKKKERKETLSTISDSFRYHIFLLISLLGVALLAEAEYEMYSFYQWGRIYKYTTVSERVINIRNATLTFVGTSQKETPNNEVTIHEQVTYRFTVPVPPIPTNLSIYVDLPRYEIKMKTWEIRELQKMVPKPPPIEQVFYDQGCIVDEFIDYDACVCYDSLFGNGTFHVIYPDWLSKCFEVPKSNCTIVELEPITVDVGNMTNCTYMDDMMQSY